MINIFPIFFPALTFNKNGILIMECVIKRHLFHLRSIYENSSNSILIQTYDLYNLDINNKCCSNKDNDYNKYIEKQRLNTLKNKYFPLINYNFKQKSISIFYF
jgi:hypothetical protein